MGENEGGLLPNGLLPNESAKWVIRVLDGERWAKAEERTAELIACIQPNEPSEQRRNAVAEYVQRLIMRCFPCQVFTFGSVPLKTYLPDGDIDLTAFSENQALKDTWASQVRDTLESEEKNENAEFRVKEVQYIQAEVKLIKCLVENIVVDISFNQLGGLCTLCFLEEVDHLINHNHLFKRSIILIKAWCYYESRILGAHHGLISTYALETLVLYIFHVFNNSFAGPLEVLYRFLEFFSNFDWDHFCVSLCGPVPISSLPDVAAEPPRKDNGELLLSKLFLHACNSVYSDVPGGQENQGQPFISKNFNVVDPLRLNNNLGRSVSKGNFYRIRSAFAFGAKRLARLLDCPKESVVYELNQFFMNTWERHGSGIRPDAPASDLWHLRTSNPDLGSDSQLNTSSSKKTDEDESICVVEVEASQSTRPLSSQRASYPLESTSQSTPAILYPQGQNSPNSSRISDELEKGNSSPSVQIDRNRRSSKPDYIANKIQGKHLFARTRSSPELTDAYCDASSQARRIKPAERSQVASVKTDSNQKKNVMYETVSTRSTVSSLDDSSSGKHSASHRMLDVTADSNSLSNSYADESVTVTVKENHASVIGAQGMHQEEQDLVNMMASSSLHNFGGHIPMPLNLTSTHLPSPISQSVLASMGFTQRSMTGMLPGNISVFDPQWAANFQFHQSLMSSPSNQYFPGAGLSTNSEDVMEQGNGNFSPAEARRSADIRYWAERDEASNGVYGPDDGNLEILHAEDRELLTSAGPNFVPLSRPANPGSPLKAQQNFTKEHRPTKRDNNIETFQHQDNQVNEIHFDDRVSSARFSSASQAGSLRSRTSSESSWDGSSARVSKVSREKRGRKSTNLHGKGKHIYEHANAETDDESGDCNAVSTTGNEIDERSIASHSISTLHSLRHHSPVFEGAQTSGSDSVIPVAPMMLGPGSRQRVMDRSGVVPFTFYPTGPPVPFFTMLPFYNYPAESGTLDPSSSPLGGEEGPDNSDSGQNIDSSVGHEAPDVLNTYNPMRKTTSVESSEEQKIDILNSDFASHWQNLQFGRVCQSPRYPGPVICSSPVSPMYLQGRVPWDGPGRPLGANVNLMSPLVSYGPRLVPVAPLQSGSSRPTAVYQRYTDELPRYRSGTGTYLPNHKASVRDRHSSGARRNSYNNYERSDYADREGNWNNAKSRAAGRSHNRSQAEKSRIERLTTNENRADRPWSAYKNDPLPQYLAQNGPLRPSSSQGGSANVAYGIYPLPGMNPGGITSNGPTVPSVVMFYPYDHHSGYVSPADQLEFGSLGPVGFVGPNDASQPIDATQLRGAFEDQRFHRSSTQQSSPDQPSSPHYHRRI